LTLDDAVRLLSLPRVIGVDPADGHQVVAANGRYGPYVQKDKESRSLAREDQLFTVTLPDALALLAQPRQFRGRAPAKPPLREFGADPTSGRSVVAREGRFGVYVTDGETNASIGRGDRLDQMTAERAFELLAIRRDQVASKDGGTARRGRGGAAKKTSGATAKKTTANKAAAKKTPTKAAATRKAGAKASAKKASAKKASAKKASAKKASAKKAATKKNAETPRRATPRPPA
jgi:DNA topoisomerase-1